jgi:magnesium chelatase family protein
MVTKVRTVAFLGLRPTEIIVEAQISPGLPSFSIVGLPDKAVGEAKERIRSSFFHLGISFPAKKVTVNMAPADIPKGGSHYDLPIALAILSAIEIFDMEFLDSCISIGELGLDGRLSYVSGTLCCAMLANENDWSLICPKACEKEALWSGNKNVIAAPDLIAILNHIKGTTVLSSGACYLDIDLIKRYNVDMSDVYGQEVAKRAIEIAAAGGHNIFMIGPPGSGKSMMAERIQTILPMLSPKEALETTCVYSIAGMMPEDGLIYHPPFRAPHHSASFVSIVGGGSDAKPGELSLANNGVLFLDEMPEFQKATIEALRQPLETRSITISRAKEHITYPANIQLIAAMNPCKCGYFGDLKRQCSKVPRCAVEYRNRISGPILDRFDIVVYVKNVDPTKLLQEEQKEKSKTIKERVISTRAVQKQRILPEENQDVFLNARIQSCLLEKHLKLDQQTKDFFRRAVSTLDISTRSCHKILRVARTIADMENADEVDVVHINEAMQFRLLDLK